MQRIGVRKYKERKILRRMFLAIFCTSVLCILIACGIGFFWMQSVYMSRMRENAKKELNNSQLSLGNAVSTANHTMEFLGKNTTVSRVIVGNSPAWDENLSNAADQLMNMVSVNRELHSIYIFGDSGSLLKAVNSQYPMNMGQNQVIEDFFYEPGQGRYQYRLLSYEDSFGREQWLLSIAAGDLAGEALANGVMVNLDIGGLMNRVFPEIKEGEAYLLLDSDYRVLGTRGEGYAYGQRLNRDPLVLAAKQAGWGRDAVVTEGEDGKRYLVNTVADQENNCILVHILPYGEYFQEIVKVGCGIAGAGVVFSLLAAGAAVWMSACLYHPIDQVVELFSSDQPEGKGAGQGPKAKQQKTDIAREGRMDVTELTGLSRMMNTMMGQLNQLEEKSGRDTLRAYLSNRRKGKRLPEPFAELAEDNSGCPYQVAALRICDIEDLMENNTPEAVVLQRQTMQAMLEQEIQGLGEALILQIDEEYAAMILYYGEEARPEELEARLRRFLSSVSELMSIQQNAGVSEPRFDREELHQAYQSARAATGYRFLYGMNELITERQMQACALNGEPGFSLEKLMDCVKSCDRQAFLAQYQELSTRLRLSSVQSAYDSLISLGIGMERYRRKMLFKQEELTVAQMEAVRQDIMSFHYIEEALNWFLDLFGNISMELNRVNQSGSGDIVRKVTDYLEENYMDVNLSAQFMAERFHITPSYFSRIFREHCGRAFPDYLSGLRLEKARAMLLEEPDRSIQSVCEAAGYLSSSYFTSMFKKKYGMTPSKYRGSQKADSK